jgi:high-affinity nickel-transport protein
MTLVDSLDSILMLYSYAGLLENRLKWQIFERREPSSNNLAAPPGNQVNSEKADVEKQRDQHPPREPAEAREERVVNDTKAKMNVMSGLSIILTFMSIIVAFAYVSHILS